jgi:predicted RNase H-like nuclease (RuvC/YqgF family)
MARTPKRRQPTATTQPVRQVEKRLATLEKAVEDLRQTVGDLKYEVEQMRED